MVFKSAQAFSTIQANLHHTLLKILMENKTIPAVTPLQPFPATAIFPFSPL